MAESIKTVVKYLVEFCILCVSDVEIWKKSVVLVKLAMFDKLLSVIMVSTSCKGKSHIEVFASV